MGASANVEGPDLSAGIAIETIPEGGVVAGHSGDEPVLLVRRFGAYFAVSGACTHYGAHLAHGLIEGDHVHCPWHHACFNLRTGEAVAAPAIDPLKQWRVEVSGGRVVVREPFASASRKAPRRGGPNRVIIVGGGAAGFAAAERLRREGFGGELTMFSSDPDLPLDRPNLSKDYLAGEAPPEWIPLKPADFYRDNGIELRLSASVARIEPAKREVVTARGEAFGYDKLLMATGASPIRLKGFDHPRVYVLRTLQDADRLIAATTGARRAVVIGAGFIGLETAGALRTRGLEVDVVAPEAAPLAKVLGPDVAAFVRAAHEERGVRFHLERSASHFDGALVHMQGAEAPLPADLVVMGVGVRPNIELAQAAGLSVSNGVEVDSAMRTSDPHIYAAGDIAAFPYPAGGARARVEHWVVAERQGQAAAINMLGGAEDYLAAPFFWSAHYDQSLRYVGYAAHWDRVDIDGSIEARDFTAKYYAGGRLLAAASLNRDRENLSYEREIEAANKAAAGRG